MSYTYANRKKAEPAAPKTEAAAKGPSLDALRTGAAKPSGEQMGRRVDLPDAMRSKMESAFGADLSAVKLYESQTVADAGANAVTQGSNIAFAPGMLDFSSHGGQALLGHEISHVVSQQRGEVSGSGGFLNDRALESRADREGAMAASGQTVAMPAAAMSSVSAAPAAGPMQAKKDKNLTMEERVRKMHAIRGQMEADEGRVRKRDKRWYDTQMRNMSPEMLTEISRQQTEAAGNMVNGHADMLASGMSEDEAAMRAHYSEASDAMQGYQSLLSNYGLQYDQTGGDYVEQIQNSLTPEAIATRSQATSIADRATHHNAFSGSEAGQAFRRNAQDDREKRTFARYKRLR